MVSPSKVQKMESQKDVKSPPKAENEEHEEDELQHDRGLTIITVDPLEALDSEDLSRYILSFLLTPPSAPPTSGPNKPKNPQEKQRPYEQLQGHHHNLRLVSKNWNSLAGDVVNAASSSVIAPRELAQLKKKASGLDLSSDFIHKTFQTLLKQKWPKKKDYRGELYDALQNIYRTFGDLPVLTKIVEEEYKRFLVVKSVVILTEQRGDETALPHMFVQLFWHAHILTTSKYYEDCQALVGVIIPFCARTGVTTNLQNELFSLEQSFLKLSYHCSSADCRIPGTTDNDTLLIRDMFSENNLNRLESHCRYFLEGGADLWFGDGGCEECDFGCCPCCCPHRAEYDTSSDEELEA